MIPAVCILRKCSPKFQQLVAVKLLRLLNELQFESGTNTLYGVIKGLFEGFRRRSSLRFYTPPVVSFPVLLFHCVLCAYLGSAGHSFLFFCQQYLFYGCNIKKPSWMTHCEWIGVNRVGSVQPDSYRTHHQLDTGWPALTWLQAQLFQNTITSRNTGWVWLYVIMKLMASLIPESTENTENIHSPLTFFTLTIFVGFCIRTARIIFHSCKLSPGTWGDYSHHIYTALWYSSWRTGSRARGCLQTFWNVTDLQAVSWSINGDHFRSFYCCCFCVCWKIKQLLKDRCSSSFLSWVIPSLVITVKPAVTNDHNLQGDTNTAAPTFVTFTYFCSWTLWTEMQTHVGLKLVKLEFRK